MYYIIVSYGIKSFYPDVLYNSWNNSIKETLWNTTGEFMKIGTVSIDSKLYLPCIIFHANPD